MQNPLTQVYFLERCNVCGATYPLNLYTIYRRQHLGEAWQSARPCEDCEEHRERLVTAVPAQALDAFVRAWDELAAALEARGLAYHVGEPPPSSNPHPTGSRSPSA